MKIDIITVYNKPEVYEEMKRSVQTSAPSDITYSFIGIDNTSGAFLSAAAAYNYAINNLSDAEVCIFCHQDIVFKEGALQKAYRLCMENKTRLIGAAGVKNKRRRQTISHIKDAHGQYNTLTAETEEVFSLDECLIAGYKDIFRSLMFNDTLCDGWHFYAVELCLRCHMNGISVAVFDANVEHLSGGNLDASFYATAEKIAKAYRRKYRSISTTCIFCYTRAFDRYLYKICKYAKSCLNRVMQLLSTSKKQ